MSRLPADLDAWLNKTLAEQAAQDALVQVTEAEIIKEAIHLLRWAKKKSITHYGGKMHKSGKWMTQMYPNMVKGLLAAGYVTGTERQFFVNIEACKELTKKYPPGSLDNVSGFKY